MTDNAVAKPMTATEQFREKIFDRIRSDIGDLMPDEMLREIVKQCIHDELNKPVGGIGGGSPWIKHIIKEQISGRVRQTAIDIVSAEESKIHAAMVENLKEQMPEMMATLLLTILKGQANSLEFAVQEILNKVQRY